MTEGNSRDPIEMAEIAWSAATAPPVECIVPTPSTMIPNALIAFAVATGTTILVKTVAPPATNPVLTASSLNHWAIALIDAVVIVVHFPADNTMASSVCRDALALSVSCVVTTASVLVIVVCSFIVYDYENTGTYIPTTCRNYTIKEYSYDPLDAVSNYITLNVDVLKDDWPTPFRVDLRGPLETYDLNEAEMRSAVITFPPIARYPIFYHVYSVKDTTETWLGRIDLAIDKTGTWPCLVDPITGVGVQERAIHMGEIYMWLIAGVCGLSVGLSAMALAYIISIMPNAMPDPAQPPPKPDDLVVAEKLDPSQIQEENVDSSSGSSGSSDSDTDVPFEDD